MENALEFFRAFAILWIGIVLGSITVLIWETAIDPKIQDLKFNYFQAGNYVAKNLLKNIRLFWLGVLCAIKKDEKEVFLEAKHFKNIGSLFESISSDEDNQLVEEKRVRFEKSLAELTKIREEKFQKAAKLSQNKKVLPAH